MNVTLNGVTLNEHEGHALEMWRDGYMSDTGLIAVLKAEQNKRALDRPITKTSIVTLDATS